MTKSNEPTILIISGTREPLTTYNHLKSMKLIIDNIIRKYNIISVRIGDCRTGVDNYAYYLIDKFHPTIPITVFKADWNQYGKAAGPIRNNRMCDEGDYNKILLAFTVPSSKGTKQCIKHAKEIGIETHVYAFVDDYRRTVKV